MRFESIFERVVVPRSLRFRFWLMRAAKCPVPLQRCNTFPRPLIRKRFFVPLCVFCFGIFSPLSLQVRFTVPRNHPTGPIRSTGKGSGNPSQKIEDFPLPHEKEREGRAILLMTKRPYYKQKPLRAKGPALKSGLETANPTWRHPTACKWRFFRTDSPHSLLEIHRKLNIEMDLSWRGPSGDSIHPPSTEETVPHVASQPLTRGNAVIRLVEMHFEVRFVPRNDGRLG